MLDRGLRRALPARRRAGGERGAPTRRSTTPRGRDLRELPTFTIDPATARDFDDAISAEALGEGHWRVWVHIADVSAYVRPGSPLDREAYRRGDERLRPRRRRADAARGAVQRRLLAAPGRRPPRGDGRDGAARRGGRPRRVPPLADPLGRAAGLRPGRPDLRRRRGGRRAVGGAARGGARRRRPRCRPGARRAARWRSSRLEPEFAFDRARPRRRARAASAPDRVPPPHRAPDDRRQRAGRDAARRARDPDALPRPRAPGARGGRAPRRAARVARRRRRRRCPSTMSPSQAAEIVAECSRARRRARPPHRPRPRAR